MANVVQQIKFNYTLSDYQWKFQTPKNGVFSTPSASNLSQVLLNHFTEELISSVDGKPVELIRAKLSPTKSRAKASCKSVKDQYKLDDMQIEQLDFVTECLKRWLPPGPCLGVPLPSTVHLRFRICSLLGSSLFKDYCVWTCHYRRMLFSKYISLCMAPATTVMR